ncbi:MAG: hypothetical protein NT113_13335 [Hyphomicrobiales bacterium]|nr:hypothetical protein [Hyphomicrobiales bacterium]
MFVLEMPFPPSVNDANRIGKSRKTGKVVVFGDKGKLKFLKDADALYMAQQRRLSFVGGPFTYHITLNEKMRKPAMDGDNRGKYVLDYLQRVGLIENDKLAEGGSWSWGPCEFGCSVIVKPYQEGEVA